MATIFIGIGELGVTRDAGGILKTMALGSCVGLVLLEPTTRTIGMVHVALPDSAIDLVRAQERPGHFADTGIPALLAAMRIASGQTSDRVFMAKIAGGAAVMDGNNTFNIGKRNILAVKKALWKHGLAPIAEDVGGNVSRTVSIGVDDGRVAILSNGSTQSFL
jgi:chemotaxis protein CheD